jgi:endo-1,4-beta-xylanase
MFMKSALIALVFVTVASTAPTEEAGVEALSGLNTKFRAKGKQFFGAAADSYNINNSQMSGLLKSEFGQVTPENSMKVNSFTLT